MKQKKALPTPLSNSKVAAHKMEIEKKLKESDKYFRTMADTVPVMVWITDAKIRCTYLNRKWFKYTGQKQGRDLRNAWKEAVHPDDKNKTWRLFIKANKNKTPFSYEYRLKAKDGNYRWMFDSGLPKFDEGGKFEGFIGSVTDIHERKLAEEALRLSEDRLKLSLEAGEIGVWEWDIQKNTINWSPKVYEFYGADPKKFVVNYKNFSKQIHPDDKKRTEEAIKKAVDGSEEYDITYRIITLQGETRWITSRALVLRDNKGLPLRMIGATSDTTEQKRMEQDKDDFISIATHELKTPVTSLKAYAEVLERRFLKAGDEYSATHMKKMNAQLDKLTGLISDLLDARKIESGKLLMEEEAFDFDELIAEVVEELQRTTEKHLLIVKKKAKKKLVSDRDRIGQVLTNLIANAIKYSPNAKEVIIQAKATSKQVTVSVQDFGVGIAKEKQQKLFERFYRVSGPADNTFPGLGLGLYISSEIIKRQGGKIWVESKKGKGSTFSFSLPLK